MTAMFKLLWKPLLSGGVLFLALWLFSSMRFEAGYQAADSAWQLKDERRKRNDAAELASREAKERNEEKRRQDEATKAAEDADRLVAQARADAADAVRAGNSLRHTIGTIRSQLAGSEAGRLAAVAEAGAARAETAILLANVLESADKRAGELAEYADRARIAGLTCQQIYTNISTKEDRNE